LLYNKGTFQENSVTNRLGQEKVLTLCEDSTGGMWFGTEDDGIFLWRNGSLSHYTQSDGLPTGQIYKILEDKNHRMWFSSSSGIFSAELTAFEKVGNHPSWHLPVAFYSSSEDIYYTPNVLSHTDPLTYPTTPAGQTQFLTDVMTQAGLNPNLDYVFYWGTCWDQPQYWYSPWPDSSGTAQDTANRGLFDANGELLPAISVLTSY
jgi:hypothetical protein